MQRTAAESYAHLEGERFHYLERGRECAALTIPHLLPKLGFNHTQEFHAPYQGMGARGVNSISASLLLALLPPNSPFFRLRVDPHVYAEMEGLDDAKAEIELSLSSMEQEVVAEIERRSFRTAIYAALRQLVVVGNVLLYFHDSGIKVIRLESYIVERFPNGSVKRIVIKEEVHASKIEPEYLADAAVADSAENTYAVYTCVYYEGDKAYLHQEIGGRIIEGSEEEMASENCPYLALRFIRVDGENYGRSFCEEIYGELETLETLQQSIVDASAAMAKLMVLVSPTGLTRPRDIAEAPNLAVRTGSAADVTFVQANKHADLSVAQATINTINDRLGSQFLLTEGSIRNAERVTAAEIRMIQDQLERSLGGVFSLLSQELQLPMVRLLMVQMKESGSLPPLPSDIIEPFIVTGVQALGRSMDSMKLDTFMNIAQQSLGPEVVMKYINVSEWFTRKAASLGLEVHGLIKTEQEMAKEQQAQMQQMMAAQAGQEAIGVAGDAVRQAVASPQVPEQVEEA